MVVKGTAAMIPELKKIWMECFGDSEGYIDFFMARRFDAAETLVWLEDGTPVGMIFLLPCRLGERPARYGYGLSVLPRFQGRGIAPRLLRAADEHSRSAGAQMFGYHKLSLNEYYDRQGAGAIFWIEEQHMEPDGVPPCSVTVRPAEPEEYTRLRDAHFDGPDCVHWDVDAVAYALEENRFCGGFGDVLSWQGREYLLFGSRQEDTLCLEEDTLPRELPRELAAALCGQYGTRRLRRTLPSPGPGVGILHGGSMGYIAGTAGWLGLHLC